MGSTTRRWFVSVLGFAVAIACGALFLKSNANGFSARAEPTSVEVFLARTARNFALPSKAKERPNPIKQTHEAMEEAMAHWADHCAVCHGNDGAGNVEMGRAMYPHAPDMRQNGTQKLTDGEIFYIIENGIRLSGMPAWGGSKAAEQSSWKLVHLIRHLPELSVEELARMEKLNPKSPEDSARELAEEQFLNGQTPAETPKLHQH